MRLPLIPASKVVAGVRLRRRRGMTSNEAQSGPSPWSITSPLTPEVVSQTAAARNALCFCPPERRRRIGPRPFLMPWIARRGCGAHTAAEKIDRAVAVHRSGLAPVHSTQRQRTAAPRLCIERSAPLKRSARRLNSMSSKRASVACPDPCERPTPADAVFCHRAQVRSGCVLLPSRTVWDQADCVGELWTDAIPASGCETLPPERSTPRWHHLFGAAVRSTSGGHPTAARCH